MKIEKQIYLVSNDDIQNELNDNINNQLNDIDFTQLESLVNNLDNSSKQLFSNNSFISLVKKFINGNNSDLYSNFLTFAISIFFENLINVIPYFSIIIIISVLYSLIGQFSSNNKSTSNIIHIVCFSSIVVVVLKIVISVMGESSNTIFLLEKQMEVIFPILLTLINAIGGVVTSTTFQPILAILSVIITKIFTTILMPIFVFSIVFGIVGNISKNVKMEKFSKFFQSLFVWIIGIVFTIFIAFLTIQGLTASGIDSISLKTAKYAIKSYIPILGSYLSDGVSLILASSMLIKNAIGATGLIILISTIFLPVIKIIIIMLLLKLTSSIIESLSDEKISNFLYSVSKSLNMIIVSLLAVGFMFLVSLSILMSCSNLF
ncbi:MAG: stage III sporulation protein AE [Clostridia bacterium]|nr:stage III sporulation protein AE [Clostridia bacterium]